MKKQGNMTPPKECNTTPLTAPKEMNICDWSEKEFKIMIWRKLSDMWENTDRSMNSGIVYEQNEKFKKEIELIKKKSEILEKNTMNEMKNVIALTSRLNQAKERILELQDRTLDIIHSEENKETRIKKKKGCMNCGTWSKEKLSILWESQKEKDT